MPPACQEAPPDPDGRASLVRVFDGKFRAPIDKAVKPIGRGLRKTRLTPDHLTIAGLVVGVGAAFAIGAGYLPLGLLLVVLAALPDLLDGALAKASDSASQRGAFFDSTVDRITDALLFGGVAWYLASEHGAHWAILPYAAARDVVADLLPAGQGRVARPRRQGRDHGAAPSASCCCASDCCSSRSSSRCCG